MNSLKYLDLFNAKIERIKLMHDKPLKVDNFDIEFLKIVTCEGQQPANYTIPRGSSKGLEFHWRRLALCDMYNSIILIKY